jgi:hypothetical protein
MLRCPTQLQVVVMVVCLVLQGRATRTRARTEAAVESSSATSHATASRLDMQALLALTRLLRRPRRPSYRHPRLRRYSK